MLLVFSGLPGTGKSTLARQLSGYLRAVYLRIDTIEAALQSAGIKATVEGYAVAYAVAAENLHLGLSVVADCVNPIALTREAWAGVAAQTGARLVNVKVVCSDAAEHRRLVELRRGDGGNRVGDWVPPAWAEVTGREYEAWTTPRLTVDTATGTTDEHLRALLAALG